MPALRVDALEVAHQKAAEIDPRGDGRSAHSRGVVLAADALGVGVEVGPLQDLVDPAVEGVRAVSPQMAGVDPKGGLFRFAFAKRHAQ